jgi:O-antigen ligase
MRVVRRIWDEPYLLSQNMYFTIFTICTAPIFLHGMSLIKYALWFLLILALIFTRVIRIRWEWMTITYALFFAWLCVTMTYTPVPMDGAMMLIKYSLPMLFLWLGYSSLSNEKDVIVLLKVVNIVGCIWCLVMGGFAATFIPPLYGFMMGICSTYAGFADFLTSIFIVPILLYWLTKDRTYVYCALWMILSTILQSVRTGMGGMLLVFAFAILLRDKWKAVPGLLLAGAVFVGTILFVPDVNKKFFGDDGANVSAMDIASGEALSMDNMDTNGREATWELIMDTFYHGSEKTGSGLGVAIRFLKDRWLSGEGGAGLIHNDYVQLLAETGNIGLLLLILFFLSVIINVFPKVVSPNRSSLAKVTGIMALSSMAGIAFCMYFDNVVSNSMQSMVMPYIYLGFFLKALDIERVENNV